MGPRDPSPINPYSLLDLVKAAAWAPPNLPLFPGAPAPGAPPAVSAPAAGAPPWLRPPHEIQRIAGTLSPNSPAPPSPDDIAASPWTSNWSRAPGAPAAAGPYAGAAASNPYLGFSADADQPDPARPWLQLDDWQRARAFITWMYGAPSARPAQPMRYAAAAADAPHPGTPTTGIDDAVDRPAPFNRPPVSSPPQPPLSAAPRRPQSTYWSLISPSGELLPVTNPVYQQPRAGADAAFVRGDPTPGDTRPPPTAADVRAAINANRFSPGAVPKPGQALPLALSPDQAQSQLNRVTGALLWGLVPEAFKRDSEEDIAEWNRRMSWYMQHPEYTGRMNLPWLKSGHPREAMLLGALDGLTWGVPAEAAAAKAAPVVKAALRAIMGGAERSAVRGAVRAGAAQVAPDLTPGSGELPWVSGPPLEPPQQPPNHPIEPFAPRPADFPGVDLTTLEARAQEIHAVLEPRAQNHRTTAVLATNKKTIVGGGAKVDLEPKQIRLLRDDEVPAEFPGADAEITVLWKAVARGDTPRALATSRPICDKCRDWIEAFGGKLVSPTLAIFPTR
jgi:hypothetical protein